MGHLSAVQVEWAHDADGDGHVADHALAAGAPHRAVVVVLEGQVDQGPLMKGCQLLYYFESLIGGILK